MTGIIYKIFRSHEWEDLRTTGVFAGSTDDLRDGFVHFSAAAQVRTTYNKYFNGLDNLVLAAVHAGRLGAALKWEISRGGEKFPHLHGTLRLTDVHSVAEIRRGKDGRLILPPEIP